MAERIVHEGRNIKRIREILGVKQDTLAAALGLTQQSVSLLEQKEKIDEKILGDVAKILKIPVEAIRNLTDETAIHVISSTFNDNSAVVNNYPVFNPLEKLMEALEENKKLYNDLLKEKDAKIALLEKMLKK